jgi:hypothetical protein
LFILSSGCIETGKTTYSVGNAIVGGTAVEHRYLIGENTYDLKITALGIEIVNVQGVTKTQFDNYLNNTLKKS